MGEKQSPDEFAASNSRKGPRRWGVARVTGLGQRLSRLREQKCHAERVTDISARELRNDISPVLRRVEGGERVRVTVSGRQVAELVPLLTRPSSIVWSAFVESLDRRRADPELTQELADLLPGSTVDLPIT